MIDFQFTQPDTNDAAIRAAAASNTAQHGAQVRYIAGGTTLVDLMKLDVEMPKLVVDINRLGMSKVERQADGTLRVGAMVRNADLAHDPLVSAEYSVLSQALLAGASAQLRNVATTGGNLLQRTRCTYFRNTAYTNCNKRTPGSGCAAIGGENRTHAILGTSQNCIATHPSDMAVAMMALEATVHIQRSSGVADVPIGNFYRLPGDTPHIENVLMPGDLITHVTLPAPVAGAKSTYLKLRDRASYEFALSSAAVVAQVEGGRITHIRLALGGVGARPWRALEAEKMLQGKPPNAASFRAAADAVLHNAKPQRDNAFKIELAKLCLVRALTLATTNA